MDELEFAQRLKRYRRERGLTQQELADRIGGCPDWGPWPAW